MFRLVVVVRLTCETSSPRARSVDSKVVTLSSKPVLLGLLSLKNVVFIEASAPQSSASIATASCRLLS